MDIIDTCKSLIEEKLRELEEQYENEIDVGDSNALTQNPTTADEAFVETDKNLNKILNQQAYLKRIIDQDNNIQILKSSLSRVALEIEGLRTQCTKLNEDAIKGRQELVQAQAKELEKYQMNQIRSISEDYNRHQQIWDQRKKEIQALKREIEREEKERGAYLADVEKKLGEQLQERQRALRSGGLPFGMINTGTNSGGGVTDELNNPDHIELTSVDEYAPYGAAPHSRLPASGGPSGGRGRGRATGRGGRGGARGGRARRVPAAR